MKNLRNIRKMLEKRGHSNPSKGIDQFDNYAIIEKKMWLWRRGEGSIEDTGYIEYHKKLANESLATLVRSGIIRDIVSTEIASDGWGDAMKVMHAHVIMANGTEKRLRWMDSNSRGTWGVQKHGTTPIGVDQDFKQSGYVGQ